MGREGGLRRCHAVSLSGVVVHLAAYAVFQKFELHLLHCGRVVHYLDHLVVYL